MTLQYILSASFASCLIWFANKAVRISFAVADAIDVPVGGEASNVDSRWAGSFSHDNTLLQWTSTS